MNKFIIQYPLGYCTKCNCFDSLVMVFGNDHYAPVSEYNDDYKKSIKLLHCMNCNTDFFIDWRDGYPRPLRDNIKIKNIINNFSK